MRIVDSRSGRDIAIGEITRYADGTSWRLLSVDQVSFSEAEFMISVNGKLHKMRGPVRRLHPKYLFQKVAFIPS